MPQVVDSPLGQSRSLEPSVEGFQNIPWVKSSASGIREDETFVRWPTGSQHFGLLNGLVPSQAGYRAYWKVDWTAAPVRLGRHEHQALTTLSLR
jgi:hypothetical protein